MSYSSLLQMRKTVTQKSVDSDAAVTSSTSDRDARWRQKRRRKKNDADVDAASATLTTPKPFSCQLCKKSFSKRKLLDRHVAFHVDVNQPCRLCGKVFDKV